MKPSQAIAQVASMLGALRDAIRGVQVESAGPVIVLEQTFNMGAATTQTFQLTVPATVALDNFDVSFSAVTTFLQSMSIGAVSYYIKSGAAVGPNVPNAFPPRYTRGLLRRIELIQGDSIVIECQNTAAVVSTVTLRVYGYRLPGSGPC